VLTAVCALNSSLFWELNPFLKELPLSAVSDEISTLYNTDCEELFYRLCKVSLIEHDIVDVLICEP